MSCKHENWACSNGVTSKWHSCSAPGCAKEWNSLSPFARTQQKRPCSVCGRGGEEYSKLPPRPDASVYSRGGYFVPDDTDKLPGKLKATDTQVGGNHYSRYAIQPIDYIVKNELDWFQGNMVKYATRFKSKGKKQDLLKVVHYAQLAMEHYYPEKD